LPLTNNKLIIIILSLSLLYIYFSQTGRYVRYILMNKANIMKEGLLRMNQDNSSNQVLEESNNNIFLNPNVKEGSDSGFDINFEKNINKVIVVIFLNWKEWI